MLSTQHLLTDTDNSTVSMGPFRPVFQGHSRSLKQTGIDRLPMTSYS